MKFFKKKNDIDTVPLTGGNAYETYYKLDAQENFDRNSLSKKEIFNDVTTNNSQLNTIQDYFLLNYFANYFVNLYTYKFSKDEITLDFLQLKRIAFMYGTSCYYKISSPSSYKYLPCYIIKNNYDKLGILESVRLMVVKDLPEGINLSELNFKDKPSLLVSGLDLMNLLFFKWEANYFGAWVHYLPFVKQQKNLLNMIETLGYVLAKKFEIKSNDPTSLNTELKIFFNPQNPFIQNVGAFDNEEDFSNRINVIENAGGSNNLDLMTYYEKFLNVYYELFGRRFNNDTKKERNVSNEVEASQVNFDILENENQLRTEMFASKIAIFTGTTIIKKPSQFNNFVDEKEEENEKTI